MSKAIFIFNNQTVNGISEEITINNTKTPAGFFANGVFDGATIQLEWIEDAQINDPTLWTPFLNNSDLPLTFMQPCSQVAALLPHGLIIRGVLSNAGLATNVNLWYFP